MSFAKRTMDETEQFENACNEFDVHPKNVLGFMRRMKTLFHPPILRTSEDVLKEAWEEIGRRVFNLEGGTEVDVDEMMRENGLDPKVRSDKQKTRNFLKESGLLQYHPGSPESWVRRIANNSAQDA